MIQRSSRSRGHATRVVAMFVVAVVYAVLGGPLPWVSASYQRISGAGSSWAGIAIDSMRANIASFGITVDYTPSGSTAGRASFLDGTVDFAASDIPFQFHPDDGTAAENPVPGSYAYIPVTAGGTSFMYNLKINGQRVTNLRLSGENVTKIFTGVITKWNDPAIQADNPGLVMPARAIVPTVRSDGSGSSAQFSAWMINQYQSLWTDYCNRVGHAPKCGFTSFYPTVQGMIAQTGDTGVAAYVSGSTGEGSIGYVNYAYALQTEFPVAKVLNKAGYYTEPTPENVAVSLLQAQINTDASDPSVYLTQNLDGVYDDTDPRSYQLSSYSYLIVPTKKIGQFNDDKGETLGAFTLYAMCQAQQDSASLGYSPMPINLVQASFDQIRKIPGAVVANVDVTQCNNPTFSPDGTNLLADNAPQPQQCDQQGGASQCPDGTGGLPNTPTAVAAGGSNGGGGAAGGGGAGQGADPNAGGAPAAGSGGGASGGAGNDATDDPTPGANTPADAGTQDDGGASGNAAPGGNGSPSANPTGSPSPNSTVDAGAATTTAAVANAGSIPASGAGGTVPAVGRGTSTATTTTVACDPDSSDCGSAPAVRADAANPASADPARSTVLDQSSGWNTSVLLVLLIVVLTVALVFAPALAWRYYAGQRRA